jgi:hypothetical protein
LVHLCKRVIGGWQRRWQIIFSVALLVFNFDAPAVAQKPHAILPQVLIDTSWNPPVGGTTWAPNNSAAFTSALQSAQPGDIIVLNAGTVYTGNFVVPAKANPNRKWIYIESSALSNLPPPGTRVSPPDAGNMPKIVTPGVTPAVRFQDGANYWRFVGIEVYSASTFQLQGYTPGVFYSHSLVDRFSNPGTSNIPDHIFFDRCYAHGDSTHDLGTGIVGNDTYFAVVDSYISEIHAGVNIEAQAVLAYTTPGPIKLVNNHLEAAGENVLFGGAGGGAFGFVPSDIEVQNNYLFKPLSWVPLSVGNNTYLVKNSFEIKSGQRVLFNKNVIQNVWSAAQNGFAILLTVRTSQSGNIAVVNDITLTNNRLENVVAGINTLAADNTCITPNCTNAGSQDRWDIINNLIEFYDPTLSGGNRNFAILLNGGRDFPNGGLFVPLRNVLFQHNTMIPAASTPCFSSVYFGVPSLPGWSPPFPSNLTNNIWLLDNVMCKQPTGDFGLQGTSGLTQYMGAPSTPPDDLTQRFFGNVMFVPPGNNVATFPPHNLATTVPLIYFNPPRDNFQLLLPKWTDTTDGLIAGVTNSSLHVSFLP